MRRNLRVIVSGVSTGLLFLAGAWAGAGLEPLPPVAADGARLPVRTQSEEAQPNQAMSGFEVGAAKVSIAPRSDLWQTEDCFALEDGNVNGDHLLPSGGDSWPLASPDCVYLGGFDIGPVRPAEGIDAGGVWVRSIAISNGTKTFVYSVIDAVGYFYRYQGGVCGDCGMYDIRNAVAAANPGMAPDDIVLASTHTHSGPDFYGGWGGIPTWYAEQVRDAFKTSIQNAIDSMVPATIRAGELYLRQFNNERRDHYYSNVDEQAVWLQARDDTGRVIATMLNYAGHPTVLGGGNRILNADWPGATARRLEAYYDAQSGGQSVGLVFEGGLGNVSISGGGGVEGVGRPIANAITSDIDTDPTNVTLGSTTMTANVGVITHPVLTNQGLIRLGQLGFFTREFLPGSPGADGPGAYHWSKDPKLLQPEDPDFDDKVVPGYLRGCDTASDIQIKTVVGAHKIGELAIFFGPGELFSNITETVKSKRRNNAATMVLGQANDALGYIMQSFEFDRQTSVATEYGTQTAEYEEVFAIDHCFGDHVLQEMLDRGGQLGL